MIDIEKLLLDKRMQLPAKHNGDYFSALMRTLTSYKNLLKENGFLPGSTPYDHIHQAHDTLHLVLDFFMNGQRNAANEWFWEWLDSIQGPLTSYKECLGKESLYRVRIGQFTDVQEMFHVPFSLRHKVATQRYSFPGLPCLYVGASPYICWQELNTPDIHNCTLAKLMLRNECRINVLNLALTPNLILHRYKEDKDTNAVFDYLIIWPLIAACSFSSYYPEEPFKAEYIIPQMLLEYIMNPSVFHIQAMPTFHVSGIKYFSARSNLAYRIKKACTKDQLKPYCNLAFPAKDILVDEESSLAEYFDIGRTEFLNPNLLSSF